MTLLVSWCGESAAIDVSEANVRFIGNEDGGSTLGHSVSGGGDFNGDGRQDVIVGQYLNNVAYIFYGHRDGDEFGFSLAGAGDVNGDGFGDIIIGAPST